MTSESPVESLPPVSSGTQAAEARRVMRATGRATLATARRDDGGSPFPSLVLTACDTDGSPLLLISTLAEHTRDLISEPRVGLLFDDTLGREQPLTGPRVSVLGRAHPSEHPRHRARYLARHPAAGFYAGFADFAIYRVTVERAYLVAGFARVAWLAGVACAGAESAGPGTGADGLCWPEPAVADLADSEAGLVDRLNQDQAEAVRRLAGAGRDQGGMEWRLTGIDPDGCDLRAGSTVVRKSFARPVFTAANAELAFLSLAGAGGPESKV